MRRIHRKDTNKEAIVKALRNIGVSVEIIERPLDLLICHRGVTALAECKHLRPTSEGGSHKYTKYQIEFIARWPGRIYEFTSPEQAVSAVLGADAMA